jgi:1,4-alpha-glucan branching enzyme
MLAAHALIGLAALMPTASHDNNVEWAGISHLDTFDRRPLCPIDGESFTVFFQTFDFDVTSARVYYDDGSPRWIDAEYSHDRGVYDVWKATLPCTAPNAVVEYYFEITDGSETDYLGPGGMDTAPPANGWVIDYNTLLHAPLGSTPLTDGGAAFKVWGQGASTCNVAGEFNGWSSSADPMTKDGDFFTARVDNVAIDDQYKFVFDGNVWKPDARARRLNPTDNLNSYVVDPLSYVWESSVDFDVPDFEEMVIYQLHVGTFAGRNDGNSFGSAPATYRSIVDTHLTHLVDLGVNVVQLMPVTEFPTDWSGGYNPISMFAIEWKSGDVDDFKYMVDKFHQAGIAVTLDVVWNHFSGSDNFLWLYTGSGTTGQIYFDGDGVSGQWETPWGSQADFDNLDVRDYFVDSGLYWIEELRLDGFRFDGTDYMNPPNGQGAGWGLMQRFNNEMDNRAIDKIAYAEQLGDDYFVTRPTSQSGAGFDSQYQDLFVDELRGAIFGAAGGTGSANISGLRNAILGGFNDGSNVINVGQTTTQTLNYFELHDEAWPSSGGERMVRTIDTTFPHDDQYARGRTLYAHGVTLFAPGIPAMFMGSEFLEDTNFEANQNNRIDWSKATTYSNYLQAVKDMVRIRKTNPALRSNAGVEVNRTDEVNDIFTMHRWDGSGNDIMVVASLANSDRNNYRIGFPQAGFWNEVFNSQASVYGGNGSGNGGGVTAALGAWDGYSYSAEITVPQMSITVFRLETCTSSGQCDDGIACTTDACVQGRCEFTPDDGLCPDDGLYCNGTESCNPFAGCVSSGDPCPVLTECTEADDACVDPASLPSAQLTALTDCLSGPQQVPAPLGPGACEFSCLAQFDFDADDDVDLRDFSVQQVILNAELTEVTSDATGWSATFGATHAFAFDSFFPGIVSGTGAVSGVSETLSLGATDLTVTDSSGTAALWDNSTGGGQLSDGLLSNGATSTWEFSTPIYGLYVFYSSLNFNNVVTMKAYYQGQELGSFSRNNGGVPSLGVGHGFVSNVPIDRVEFTFAGTDSRVLLGAGNGVDGGESDLGTVTIPGYGGPSGATVDLDFAIATSAP